MENNWASLLKQGCEVNVTITIYYEEENTSTLRPDHFEIVTKAVDPKTLEQMDGKQNFKNVYGQEFNEAERIVY